MDDKQTSKWIVAATCSSLVLLMAVGGIFALRDQLFAQARADSAKQTAEREKLATRLSALDSELEALAQSTKPDSAPIDALSTKIDELNHRIDLIEKAAAEKKPEPAPVAPAPIVVAPPVAAPLAATETSPPLTTLVLSGKPFTAELDAWQKAHPNTTDGLSALAPFAEKGLPTEAQLIDKLRDVLDAIPTTASGDVGPLANKINTQLSGLITIKKTAPADPYAALRTNALRDDYTSLLREVEQLPLTTRAPFTAWLQAAHARAAAVSALATLAGRAA
ncbi:MAG: hypothetical protein V4735_07655 [Pseudomonadota bacterium]